MDRRSIINWILKFGKVGYKHAFDFSVKCWN